MPQKRDRFPGLAQIQIVLSGHQKGFVKLGLGSDRHIQPPQGLEILAVHVIHDAKVELRLPQSRIPIEQVEVDALGCTIVSRLGDMYCVAEDSGKLFRGVLSGLTGAKCADDSACERESKCMNEKFHLSGFEV